MVLSLYLSRGSPDIDEIRCPGAHFGSRNRHVTKILRFSKFKMADVRHIENRLLAISQRFIVRLTRNLVHRSSIMLRHRLHDEITNFINSRWQKAGSFYANCGFQHDTSCKNLCFANINFFLHCSPVIWIPVHTELSQAWFASDVLIKMTVYITLVISVTDSQWMYMETNFELTGNMFVWTQTTNVDTEIIY